MAYLRDHVVILKKETYRERDRRYALYGRRFGLMWTVARGSLRITSKQSGQLEPLGFAEVMVAKGRAYDHLAVATSAYPKKRIKTLGGLVVAGTFADVCLNLLRPGLPDARLFALWEELNNVLSELPREPSSVRATFVFASATLRLLDILGYGPALHSCVKCQTELGEGWRYVPVWNGSACDACKEDEEGTPISSQQRAVFRLMQKGELKDVLRLTVETETVRCIGELLREFLKHTPLEREPHGWSTIQKCLL